MADVRGTSGESVSLSSSSLSLDLIRTPRIGHGVFLRGGSDQISCGEVVLVGIEGGMVESMQSKAS